MRKCLLYFFLLCAALMFAQPNNNVSPQLFKINALAPGVSYEVGIAKNTTLNFDAVFGFAARGGSGRDTEFGLFPGINGEIRYFTNMERRKTKGKNIGGDSGNYLALSNQLQSGNPIIGSLANGSSYYYNIAALYGIQRTREKGFYWGVSFGPGVFNNEFDTEFGLLVNLRLGWVIRKRR